MFPIEYEAHIWNECKNGGHGEEEICHGITFGINYADAMGNIEEYYGDDLISIKLYMLEEVNNPIYEFETNMNSDFHGMFKIDNISIQDSY